MPCPLGKTRVNPYFAAIVYQLPNFLYLPDTKKPLATMEFELESIERMGIGTRKFIKEGLIDDSVNISFNMHISNAIPNPENSILTIGLGIDISYYPKSYIDYIRGAEYVLITIKSEYSHFFESIDSNNNSLFLVFKKIIVDVYPDILVAINEYVADLNLTINYNQKIPDDIISKGINNALTNLLQRKKSGLI